MGLVMLNIATYGGDVNEIDIIMLAEDPSLPLLFAGDAIKMYAAAKETTIKTTIIINAIHILECLAVDGGGGGGGGGG